MRRKVINKLIILEGDYTFMAEHHNNQKLDAIDIDRVLHSLLTPVRPKLESLLAPVRPKQDALAKEKRRRFIEAIEELGKAPSKDKK